MKSRKNDDDIFEVVIPFVYKDNAIFLKDKKVADIKEDEDGTCDVSPLKPYSREGADWVIDYYTDKKKNDLKENEKDEFEVPVKAEITDTYSDPYIDSRGDEYSSLGIEFKVYFGDIDVTDLLSKKDLQDIDEKMSEIANEGYTPRYLGTHRIYP
jgi:hypothetical protein